jgi:prephenate dehydratase
VHRSTWCRTIPAGSSVVKKAGLDFKARKSGFLIQGEDRPGALAQHLRKLGDSGVNVTGIDSLSAGEGRWGAILWVEESAVRRAAKALGAKV